MTVSNAKATGPKEKAKSNSLITVNCQCIFLNITAYSWILVSEFICFNRLSLPWYHDRFQAILSISDTGFNAKQSADNGKTIE
jgi:hypothetical protein